MKIIEQSHKILSYDSYDLIELAGRTCYKSEDKIGCKKPAKQWCPYEDIDNKAHRHRDGSCAEGNCHFHSSGSFVRQLIKLGHEAMLEHAGATVRFITNRGVTHELVRHRVASFGQESTRYVKYASNMEFIKPAWFNDNAKDFGTPEAWFIHACGHAESAYGELIDLGWRPEQAREVLPNSLKTEIVVTANYREWRHILNLRAIGTTGKPHPQMQALMSPLLAEFKEKLPALFEDLELPQ